MLKLDLLFTVLKNYCELLRRQMVPGVSSRILFALLVTALIGVPVPEQTAVASSPALKQVRPRGLQRGTKHKLTFTGDRLGDAHQVLFYDDGFQVIDLKVIDAKKVVATVAVDSGCRLGEHVVQLVTQAGVSGYRSVQVEAYPAVDEDEAQNNSRETPLQVEPQSYSDQYPQGVGVVVSGRIMDEDHDWFAVEGKRDQRLSLEVVGTRLGDFCDPTMELYGPDGNRLAFVDDTPFSKQDPLISVRLPMDGRYLIHLTDSAGRGSPNAWYRLHIGNFPRPTFASPAVAKAGKRSEVVFLGDCLGPLEQSIDVVPEDLYQDSMLVSDRFGTTPTPVPFRLVSDNTKLFNELEPNNIFRKLPDVHSIPFSVAGVIDEAGDRDTFGFKAKKGQQIRVEAFGHRIGSSIDTTIRFRNSDGRVLKANTDSKGTDSVLAATIPADGRYSVEVEDADRKFGSTVRYQLDVAVVQPSLTLGIQEFLRYTQQRKQVAVPAGNRFATLLTMQRNGFDGQVQLTADGLPDSIRMFAKPMPPESNTIPVVFEAAEVGDAESTESNDAQVSRSRDVGLVKLVARSIAESDGDSSNPVVGYFRDRAQLMRVAPNNMCFKFVNVDRLAFARLDPVPFKIELEPPQAPMTQSGRMNLRVNIQREEGFKDPITLRFPFRPPGVAATPTIKVKPNQESIVYPISANDKAVVGNWPICVTAVAPNDLGAMVSTSLRELELVAPWVSVEGNMVRGPAGSKQNADCTVEVLSDFEGTADVQLTPLPAGVTCRPQSISSDSETVSFPIEIGAACVPGKNYPVDVLVTIKREGHPVKFKAGRLLMRFSAGAKSKRKPKDRQAVGTKAPGSEETQ